jgi:hypothetical protein
MLIIGQHRSGVEQNRPEISPKIRLGPEMAADRALLPQQVPIHSGCQRAALKMIITIGGAAKFPLSDVGGRKAMQYQGGIRGVVHGPFGPQMERGAPHHAGRREKRGQSTVSSLAYQYQATIPCIPFVRATALDRSWFAISTCPSANRIARRDVPSAQLRPPPRWFRHKS